MEFDIRNKCEKLSDKAFEDLKRIFYNLLWALVFLFWCIFAQDSCSWKFTYFGLILNLCYFVWFVFIIYAMGLMKNKGQSA